MNYTGMIKFSAIRIPVLKNASLITEIHSEKTGTPQIYGSYSKSQQISYRKRVIFMPKCAILINSEQSRAEQSRAEQSRAEQTYAQISAAEKLSV